MSSNNQSWQIFINEFIKPFTEEEKKEMIDDSKKLEPIPNNENCRIFELPIGLLCLEKLGYFNCLIQILFQNKSFVKFIYNYKVDTNSQLSNSQKEFINELKLTFARLTISNQRVINLQSLFLTTSKCFSSLHIETQLNHNQNIRLIQFYETFMQTLKKQFKFDVISDQYFIQGNENQDHEYYYDLPIKDQFFYYSILNTLKIQDKFPKQFVFHLDRTLDSNIDYWIPTKFFADIFLENSNQFREKIKQHRINSIKNMKQSNQWQTKLNNFQIVKQNYENRSITPLSIVQSLEGEYNYILNGTETLFPRNWKQLHKDLEKDYLNNDSTDLNSRLYQLQTIVIEISEGEYKHYYSYSYNIVEEQWYKYNDQNINSELEEIVLLDARKNGYMFIYIINEYAEYLKEMKQAERTLQVYNSRRIDLFQEKFQCLKLIPKDIISKIEQENEKFWNENNKSQ